MHALKACLKIYQSGNDIDFCNRRSLLVFKRGNLMRIPPYWVKETYTDRGPDGTKQTFSAYGWSFESEADARERAEAHAKKVFEQVTSGEEPEAYEYLERPIREQIVDSVTHEGEEIAKITRNRYGALILNARTVCFADVDFPEVQPNGWFDSLLLKLFSSRYQARRDELCERTVQRIQNWADDHPERSFRLYRTRAGLRLLFTDTHYDPTSENTHALLEELGCDELYRKLTEKQECFRARLTPKPWRADAERPPAEYPFDNSQEEEEFQRWLETYQERSRSYATCSLLESRGTVPDRSSIRRIVDLHDEYCCTDNGAPLA